MRVFRLHVEASRREEGPRRLLALRCPRCGGELIVRLGRIPHGSPCRCPVRRNLALGA